LRERYEAFLEEERQRRERNDRILQTLDRIESRAAVLTAKSERLGLLRVSNL
jgi:cell division septum initiation protein DivIVA